MTNEAVNQFAEYFNISIESTDIIGEDDKHITIKAVAIKGNLRHVGIIRQRKQESSGREKQFALENAISKAQRNAKKGLLPMATIRDYINKGTDPNYNAATDNEVRLEKAKTVYLEQQDIIDEMQKETDKIKSEYDTIAAENKELGRANAEMREVLEMQKEEIDALNLRLEVAKKVVKPKPELLEPSEEVVEHMTDEEVIEQSDESAVSENATDGETNEQPPLL